MPPLISCWRITHMFAAHQLFVSPSPHCSLTRSQALSNKPKQTRNFLNNAATRRYYYNCTSLLVDGKLVVVVSLTFHERLLYYWFIKKKLFKTIGARFDRLFNSICSYHYLGYSVFLFNFSLFIRRQQAFFSLLSLLLVH